MKRFLSYTLLAILPLIAGTLSTTTNVPKPLTQAAAHNTFGTLSNFDVFNDTGDKCHGVEIELDGVTSKDIQYTFGAPYIRYGNPKLVDTTDANGNPVLYVRYESPYDPATGTFTQSTQFAPSPITPTDGHACYMNGPVGAAYETSGCEHFGLGLGGNPTKTSYHWLIEDPAKPGNLTYSGSTVSLPAPIWVVSPPAVPGAQPVVQADIQAEPPQAWEFGEAQWVKVFSRETPNPARLEALLTDNPAVPQGAAEVEVEWVLMQTSINGAGAAGQAELLQGGQLGAGNNSVTRRYEFYKYAGAYDPETHEVVLAVGTYKDSPFDINGNPTGDLGDYIGAEMAAVNLDQPLVIAAAALSGEVSVAYNLPIITGGAQPYTIAMTGGTVPDGLTLDSTGILSGTPVTPGLASFTFDVTDTHNNTVSGALSVNVADIVSISTVSLLSGTVGKAYSFSLTSVNGLPSYLWSLVTGTLPSGLSLKGNTISGTPKAASTAAVTVGVTDSAGVTATKNLTLTVVAAPTPTPGPTPKPSPTPAGTTKVEGRGTITTLGNSYIVVNALTIYYNASTTIKLNDIPAIKAGVRAEYKGTKDAKGVITASSLEIN